mgnify:CR=1 FL=1
MDLFLEVLFRLTEPDHLIFLVAGTFLGMTVGILPGLGGTTALAILLPFVSNFEPTQSLALMIGVLAPTTTSDTFPAVLLGIPGTAGSQATVLDGFPMSKQGMASRALNAAFLSSLVGGVWGAIVLTFSIVFAKPIILAVGFGEQFLLIILALIMVGALTGANIVKGIASCVIGLVIGAIGLAQITADPRLTFGTLYLSEGVPLVVVGMGLFAIPEIVALLQSKSSITGDTELKNQWSLGFSDVVKNWFLVFRCSSIGVLVGALPGLGGTVVDWIAYSHLRQTARTNQDNIGKGDIRGVIAPESANNAKEGGALIPTILFGIPGSGNKVLLLGGFILVGIEPGIEMVTTQIDVTYTIIWSLALANIVAAGICIFLAKPMAKITTVPYYILAPVLISLVFFASYQVNREWNNFAGLLFFGFLGVVMKTHGWSRPALLIGFFLSSKIELLSYQTAAVYGFSFLWRTGSLILIILTLVTLWFLLTQKIATEKQAIEPTEQKNHIFVTVTFLIFPISMLIAVHGLDYRASLYPIVLSCFLLILLCFLTYAQIFERHLGISGKHRATNLLFKDLFTQDGNFKEAIGEFLYFPIFLILILIFGFPIAMPLFIVGFISMRNKKRFLLSIFLGIIFFIITWVLAELLTMQYPSGLISKLIDLPWWLRGH